MRRKTWVAVVAGALVLVAVPFAYRALQSREASAPLPATVEWERVVAALALLSEEYQEALESPERREKRLAAMERQAERSLALARRATPRAPEIEERIARIAKRVEGDPDRDFVPECKRITDAIGARVSLSRVPAVAPDLKKGEEAFARACASCHGRSADGVSPVASSMVPPPANLLQSEHAWRPYDMFLRVTYGGMETAMPPFLDTLSAAERWDIVFFLFAQRWPACDHEAAVLSSSELAVSRDFDLTDKVGYGSIGCVRRHFVGP